MNNMRSMVFIDWWMKGSKLISNKDDDSKQAKPDELLENREILGYENVSENKEETDDDETAGDIDRNGEIGCLRAGFGFDSDLFGLEVGNWSSWFDD